MKVRELVTLFRLKLDNASVRQAEASVNSLKDNLKALRTLLYSLGTPVAGWLTLKGVVNIIDDLALMRTRIGSLMQTTTSAGEAFDEMAKHASAAGMSIEGYGTLYYRIGNSSEKFLTTQKDLLKVTDAISQSMVIGGVQGREAAAVMLQFSQALQSGRLQGDEYRTMRENAAWYLKQIAEELDIPMEKMKEMSSQGKLTSELIIKATLAISDKIQKEFDKFPMTFGRALTIAANKFQIFADHIDRESNFIDTWSRRLLYFFDVIEQGLWGLRDYFAGLNNVLRIVAVHFATFIGIKAVLAVRKLTQATLILYAKWALFAVLFLLLAAAVDDIIVTLRGGDSLINRFSNKLNSLGDQTAKTNAVAQFFDDIADGMNSAIDAIGEFLSALVDAFVDTGREIADAIMEGIVDGVIEGIKAAGDFLQKGTDFLQYGEGFTLPGVEGGAVQNNNITVNVEGSNNPDQVRQAAMDGTVAALEQNDYFTRELSASV